MTKLTDLPGKKRPYRSPKLVFYGDLGQITRAGGSSGTIMDGKPPGMAKT